jgi:nicotinamide-nucleotide amidase
MIAPMTGEVRILAAEALALADRQAATVVTAESCTGGLLAAALSEAPGASSLLQGGFVTYTKESKTAVLGVSAELLRSKGAVCPEVAVAMGKGAIAHSPAQIAVAVTGVAGPSSDEDGNPVGLVCIAVVQDGGQTSVVERNYGDIGRDAIRTRAIADALSHLTQMLLRNPS